MTDPSTLDRVRAVVRDALVNPTERRPRAAVRLVGGGIVVLLVVLAVQVLVLSTLAPRFGAESPVLFGVAVATAGMATMAALVPIARYLDRRRFVDYGFRIDRDWWIDCAFGLALGIALQAAVFLVGWAAGWFAVTGTFVADGSFLLAFVGLVGLFLVVGIYEEALVRGWLLTNVAEGCRFLGERWAITVALIVSSGLFGLLHAGNPGATVASVTIISAAGVLLAAGYLLTGELAIPIGIHVTWNLAQGGLFGHGVSGLGTVATVIATEPTGPVRWTGGAFGPEGGLLGLFAVFVGCVAVVAWVRFRTGDVALHPAVTTPELRSGTDGKER